MHSRMRDMHDRAQVNEWEKESVPKPRKGIPRVSQVASLAEEREHHMSTFTKAGLSENERYILWARMIGFSTQEIIQTMPGETRPKEGNVRRAESRAREKLKRWLKLHLKH